jgi:hypothetical protein
MPPKVGPLWTGRFPGEHGAEFVLLLTFRGVFERLTGGWILEPGRGDIVDGCQIRWQPSMSAEVYIDRATKLVEGLNPPRIDPRCTRFGR